MTRIRRIIYPPKSNRPDPITIGEMKRLKFPEWLTKLAVKLAVNQTVNPLNEPKMMASVFHDVGTQWNDYPDHATLWPNIPIDTEEYSRLIDRFQNEEPNF